MSFCRFSTDNFNCDVYCYEHVDGGYVIHVAGRRAVGEVPKVPELNSKTDIQAWVKLHQAQMDWFRTAKFEAIGGPHDGKSFGAETLEEFKSTLLMLREAGYNFPDSVLDVIEEQLKEEEETK